MLHSGFTRDQSALLWSKLESSPGDDSRLEPAHVGYFFGALLVIGAMGWFITDGWDRFAGWQLTAIACQFVRGGGIGCLAQVDVPSSGWTADQHGSVHDASRRLRCRASAAFVATARSAVVYAFSPAHQCKLGWNGC